MSRYFITGIGTDVGKTVIAAIVTEAIQADYWKPIQSGLDTTDAGSIQTLVSNNKTTIHPEAYRLKTPMSPHKAAAIDGVEVRLEDIKTPPTSNNVVVEGAGGLLVPINNQHTIADLIQPEDKIIVVSAGYLGSINHTLLTLQVLKQRGLTCSGIIYNHVELDGTIEVIEKMSGVPTLGHIPKLEKVDAHSVLQQADELKEALLQL